MDIWESIEMLNNHKKEINLLDLIDIDFLQKLQDSFADTMGIAALTFDNNGPLTKPSNFTGFCKKYMRSNPVIAARCEKSDNENSELAVKKGEPVIFSCHAGITNFVVPIIVKGNHIASILGGQIFTEKPDEKHFKDLAKEFGITDTNNYIKDLRNIKIIPAENIKAAINLLSLVANSISKIAHKNYELITKNEREKLTGKIVEQMRSTLDAEEVKNYFLEIVQSYFGADRCIFADYDSDTGKFIPFSREKLKSPEIKSLIGVDLEEVFPEFCTKLKRGKDIIIKDLEKTLSRKSLLGYKAIKTLKESEAKSDYGLLVKCGEEIVGILILHFIKEKKVLSHDEFDFLKIIREHAGTALCQSKLYEITRKQAEREQILRYVSNRIRSSLDIEEIKHEIVTQIGKLFNANRVVIAYYDYKLNNYMTTKEAEYRSSDKVKTFVDVDFVGSPGFIEYIRNTHFQGKDIIFNDLEKYIDENNYRNTDLEKFYRAFEFASSAAINIYYENKFLGNLVITFEKKREITEDEINFLKTIADQAGVAFHQAELYLITKKQAEIEHILIKITNQIRSSLDVKEIKKEIITQFKNFFKPDRIAITYYDKKIKDYIITKEAEYLSSEKMSSATGIILKDIPGFAEYIQNVHHQGKDIIFSNLEDYLDENNLRGNPIENFYRDFGFIASAAMNISYDKEFLGNLVISYEYPREFSDNEIFLLTSVANQIGIAFHQSEMYSAKKLLAQKESLIRNITETTRKTLDIKETKQTIVDIIGKTLNADRCVITEYDKDKEIFLPIREEYLASKDIISLKEFNPLADIPNIVKALENGSYVVFNNKEIFVDNKKMFFAKEIETMGKFNVFSGISFPLFYKDELIGVIGVHYVCEHIVDEEEIELMKTITNQLSTAIFQAKLFHITQEQNKKERLIRNVTDIIRSSLDIDETKKKIITTIGETLKADRCFIMEYNKANDKILIINEEYLSTDAILSYKGVDLNEHIPSMVAEFKKGKRLIINESGATLDGEKVNFEDERFEDVRKAVEKYKVNSALVFPLYYSGEFLGDLVLHYTEVQAGIGNEEIDFLNLISNQIALALHQSKLYERVQLQAERERISRNIIEILRSTLDKNMIEHLFVRNIGKYFTADRVFFSEFDNRTNLYLSVSEQSEYLSSTKEKSFAGYDFSTPEMISHLQPLLDKRELIIPNWGNYVEKNMEPSKLVEQYKEANVKSSYSFPVLYEGKIMGFFCIEFTRRINELMDEDISRLRSICTQAGIALYHAELYLDAQKALQSKGELITKVKNGIEKPVDDILKSSKVLSELELERDKQKECLNNIIKSCNQLLELTKDITED